MTTSIYFLLMGAPGGTQTKTQWKSGEFVSFIYIHASMHTVMGAWVHCFTFDKTHSAVLVLWKLWKNVPV